MGLSLSRTAGQSIVIRTPAGEEIVVTVKRIEVAEAARTARVVVEAPRNVEILRGEIA